MAKFKLIEEKGIIDKRIISPWLYKVQDVTCKLLILGRGFRDIDIESAGNYWKFGYRIEKAISDSS